MIFFLLAVVAVTAPRPVEGQIRSRIQEAARKAQEARERAAKEKAAADSLKAKAAADSATAKAPAESATAAQHGAGPAGTAAAARVDPKIWDNYDFVPGSKVLFYTDFSDDKVGNFATRLKHKAGSMDVVERDGVRVLRATSRSEFLIPVGNRLPDRFTLELGVIIPETGLQGFDVVVFEGGPVLDRGDASAEISWNPNDGTMILGGGQDQKSHVRFPGSMIPQLQGREAQLRVLMDGGYFKLYVNERRQYNIPELAFKRDSVIRVFLRGAEESGMEVYVTRIRVAESETDVLYDALANKGRWATQGILFATGKAEIQPESRPVLKEIAGTLKQHEDLKILIEGHTDNVGQAASNLALSEARAAAVKAALVTEFGIDEGRITTQGFGNTKPAVPNTTPEGRAQNRRVEIVKS
jgi:outer membrane protein OmpA-like peptidoglycan-associated protein